MEVNMATFEQIQARMKKLQLQADALIAKKAQAAVDQIRQIMLTHGLTTEDIEAKAKAKREAKAMNGSASNVNAKAASSLKGGTLPKYQHPKTGATWTGRGRARAWLAAAKDGSKFLIAGADAGSSDAGSANLAGKKATAKKIAAKKAVATKPAAKKAPAKKTVTAKTASKKVAVKATKKPAVKKVPTKKASPRSTAVTAPSAVVETVAGSTA